MAKREGTKKKSAKIHEHNIYVIPNNKDNFKTKRTSRVELMATNKFALLFLFLSLLRFPSQLFLMATNNKDNFKTKKTYIVEFETNKKLPMTKIR